jgi:hypothetical protein
MVVDVGIAHSSKAVHFAPVASIDLETNRAGIKTSGPGAF